MSEKRKEDQQKATHTALRESRAAALNLMRDAVAAREDAERANAALRDSDERFRSVLGTSLDVIYRLNVQTGRFEYISPSAEKVMGFSPEELMAQDPETALAMIHPDDLPAMRAAMARAEQTGEAEAEYRQRTKSGDYRWISNHISLTRDRAGRPLYRNGNIRDITERKRAEEERSRLLAESENRAAELDATISSIAIGLIIYNPAGKAVYMNMTAKELLPPEIFFGMTLEERARVLRWETEKGRPFPPEEIPVARALRGETTHNVVLGASFPDHKLWISASAAPIRTADGRMLGAVASFTDVTESKRAEKELQATLRRFYAAFSGMYASILLVGDDGRVEYANQALCDLFELAESPLELAGLTAAETIEKIKNGYLHPDAEVARIQDIVRRGQPVRGEEIAMRGGRTCLRDFIPMTVEGKSYGRLWHHLEITDRKGAEEERTRSSQKLAQVLDSIQDDFYVLDRGWKFIFASRQFTSRIGKEPREFLGRNIWEMFPKHVGTVIDENFRATMEKREVRRFEVGGRYTEAWYSMTSFPSAEGITVLGRDITERKRMEEALRESEERFRQLADASFEGLVIHDNGLVLDANKRVTEMLGHDRADLIGQPFWKFIDPKSHDLVREKVRQGASDIYEVELIHVNSRHVPVEVTGRSLTWQGREVRAAAFRDITERKKTEALRQALAEQERIRLGAAVEQASDAVVMLDLDGSIRYVNAAFEAINQSPRAEVLGRSYFDLLAGHPSAAAVRDAVVQGRAWHGPIARSVRDGRPIELEVTISPAKDPAGAVIGGLVTERDVTQENALQRQVRQAQKMEALGTLAGGITHDFNNILGAIIINTELALLDLDPANPARTPLPLVLQAANRGKDLVKQIITFSRQRAWERKPLEIVPIVKEGMRLLRSTLPQDITIQETIDPASGIVLADPSHIHQIIVNLCQNAALAMRDRGGRLEIRLEPAEVDESVAARHPDLKPGPYVRLTVADDGCGMPPELVERIFEPFFTTRGPGGGSGLGLAVVQGIVKSYNGAILVYSEPGKGSVFHVYLPRLDLKDLAEGAIPQLLPVRGDARILFVEDEEAQRTSLTRGLEHLGYRVTARADGRSALAAFQKDAGAFDLVITDQSMPRMSGLELAAALVKIRPDVPIILCTGFSEKVNGATVGQNGIREFVMKPFTLQEITRLIGQALGKKTDAGESGS